MEIFDLALGFIEQGMQYDREPIYYLTCCLEGHSLIVNNKESQEKKSYEDHKQGIDELQKRVK